MRVFVTGATGFVGSAVVQDLLAAGHTVVGLTRSEAGAASLRDAGAEAIHGRIEDLDLLARAAAASDGVIHTGFNHDFSRFAASCEEDRLAIEAMGSALAGSKRALVVTAGVAGLAPGRLAVEDDLAPPPSPQYPRASEAAMAALAEQGVHASVVRLPPSVHGAGDHGFVPILVDLARRSGRSAWIGEGSNRWAATHRLDAAPVFRLALERAARGAHYHAVAEEGIAFREIATLIGARLGVPVVGLDGEEADAHFGWFGKFAGLDMAASSVRTRALLGWTPRQAGLIADMEAAGYFGTCVGAP